MKKRLLVCLFIPFLLGACNAQPGGGDNKDSIIEQSMVTIKDPAIEDIYGGTNLKLYTSVAPDNLELTWTSSNEEVATVSDGTVTFKNINEQKDVTIKAISTKDQEIFDQLDFTVKPNPIDIEGSNGYSAANFYTTGMTLADGQKILFKNDASSTFFYKASFNGKLLQGTGEFGFYLYTDSSNIDDAFLTLGVDGRGRMQEGGFPYLLIKKGGEVKKVALAFDGAFKEGVYRELAIGKYEQDLYIFGENNKALACMEKFFKTFDENQQYKVGIFSKGFEVNVKSFRASLNENDVLFGEPTNITLGADRNILVGDEFDLEVRGNKLNLHPGKIAYVSTDEKVATVNARGHVVAVGDGDTVIKARYDNKLQASINVHVDKVIRISTFVLNEQNTPASFDGDVTIKDSVNNSLIFNYSGASASNGNHMALADGGYLINKEAFLDLRQLSIKGTGTFKLYTGFEAYEDMKTFTVDNSEQEFELIGVSYIKVQAVGDAVVNSITGTHNGLDTEGKDLLPGLAGSTLMFDVLRWNRLVHDVDASKDFEYSVTFRQITDETNYLKRPAFFIYPAEYNEEDEILHTNTSHYFNGTGGYLHIRESNSQLCHKAYNNAEKTVCTADAWINDSIIGTKECAIGGLWGIEGEEATTATQSRITRDCILTVTFKLENVGEGAERYQKWSVRLDCQSFANISGIDYSGNYTKTYALQSQPGNGNVFPCERIGIAIGHGYDGTYKVLSASSTGVR